MKPLLSLQMMGLIAVMVGCSPSADSPTKIGGHAFCVPDKNYVSLSDGIVESAPRFDTGGPSLFVAFESDELARAIPGFVTRYGTNNSYKGTLQVAVYAPSSEKLTFMESSKPYQDVLTLSGSFRDGVVAYDKKYELYKVSRQIEAGYSWQLLSKRPSVSATVPPTKAGFWEGRCMRFGDGSGVSCEIEFPYEDLYLSATFTGPNFGVRGRIKEFIEQEFRHWENACSDRSMQ